MACLDILIGVVVRCVLAPSIDCLIATVAMAEAHILLLHIKLCGYKSLTIMGNDLMLGDSSGSGRCTITYSYCRYTEGECYRQKCILPLQE